MSKLFNLVRLAREAVGYVGDLLEEAETIVSVVLKVPEDVEFIPGHPIVRPKETVMPKAKCVLFKKSTLKPAHKSALQAAPAKKAATPDYSFLDSENGTGTFGGLDAAGNPVPLDPAIWSIAPPTIAPDQTIISSVTVSGLGITFVATGVPSVVGSPVQVTCILSTSDNSVPPVTIVVPVDVTLGPANQAVFVPGTPVVR